MSTRVPRGEARRAQERVGTLGSSQCSHPAGEMEAPAAWVPRAATASATPRVAQKARGISGRSSVQSSTAPTSRASATGGCPTTQVRALLRSAAGFSQHTLGSHSPLEMRCHLDNDLILSTAHCSPETGVARSFPSFPLSMQSSDVPVSRPASSGSEALPLHHRGVWDSEGPHGGVVLYGANSAKG